MPEIDDNPTPFDLYAGGSAKVDQSVNQPEVVFIYTVEADIQPDVLLRVASQLLLTNTLPEKVVLTHSAAQTVIIEITLAGINAHIADAVRRKLAQLSCTISVCLCTG
jgi:hypothetical protein